MMFALFGPLGWVVGQVAGAVSSAASGIFDATAIGTAVEAVTGELGTMWLHVPTPNLVTSDGSASPTIQVLHDTLAPYAAAVMVFAIIAGATRMVLETRAEYGRGILIGLLTWVTVTGAGTAVIALLVAASDAASTHIIDTALAGDTFGTHLAVLFAVSGGATPMAPFLLIVMGLFALLTTLIQLALMIFRVAAIVVLVAGLPFAASFAAMQTGRVWLGRYATLLFALILYRPAAAVVYAVGFRLVDEGSFSGHGIIAMMVGLMVVVTSIVALPVLLKIVAPAVGHLGLGHQTHHVGNAARAAVPNPVAEAARATRAAVPSGSARARANQR